MMRFYNTFDRRLKAVENIDDAQWIRLTSPTKEEISMIAELIDIDVSDVGATLDREEGSRVEIDGSTTIMIVDLPILPTDPNGPPYSSMPIAIFRTPRAMITVAMREADVVTNFINTAKVDLDDKVTFTFALLFAFSTEYQRCLRDINRRRKQIESNIHQKTRNEDIIELHNLESSLVFFITSLNACNMVIEKIKRSKNNFDEDALDLLEDVIVENDQAIKMARTYQKIIDSTRDLFVAVTNNRLNDKIKWLTMITIILTIPMIVTGFYGMNVELPIAKNDLAYVYIIIMTVIVCALIAIWMRKNVEK